MLQIPGSDEQAKPGQLDLREDEAKGKNLSGDSILHVTVVTTGRRTTTRMDLAASRYFKFDLPSTDRQRHQAIVGYGLICWAK